MTGLAIYRTAISPDWIDYNGHLRDAYYSLIVSLASDALMDRLGMDEAYRARTRCTLYTLEMHMHFLREVKKTDIVDVAVRVLATDRKRIHAAFDMRCERYPEPVASAELMLLHVHQGEKPEAHVFPPEVAQALAKVAADSDVSIDTTASSSSGATVSGTPGGDSSGTTAAGATAIPGSRRIELRSRS
jgi:acyl-CoA thioester hydrolase